MRTISLVGSLIEKSCKINRDYAVSSHAIILDALAPCTHGEPDAGRFVHARHGAAGGKNILIIKVNDTYVLVIAVSFLPILQELGLKKLWLALGQGHHLKWIPVHDLYTEIGPQRATCLQWLGYRISLPWKSIADMGRVFGGF